MKLKVNVTRDDLDNGFRESGQLCPIALAVMRACKEQLEKELLGIEIDGDITLSFAHEGYELCIFKDKDIIEEFIRRYDKEDYVSPFEHEFSFAKIGEEEEYDYYDEGESLDDKPFID